jgi:multidrug efflux pump subunit AcrA (membrane-fusion protein)
LDIARPDVKRSKQIRRILYGAAGVVAVILITGALHTLKPAAPSVDKATIWTDTVKRGSMLREVRGLGTLVPETIRLIPAITDGRVEQRFLLPGVQVKADTVILKLSNPDLQRAALDAEYQLKGGEAELTNVKAQLQNQLMDKTAAAAGVRSEFHQAKIQADTNAELFKLGLIADVVLQTSQVKAEELAKQNVIAEEQVKAFANSIGSQVAVEQAKVDGLRAMAQLKETQVAELNVRPGIDGVLQELDVEVGQNVVQGTVLARVAQPSHLKAQLKIAETQAKDILIGQKASVDTHNGVIPGHVSRIDPAVVNGTVTVDCALDGPLPSGARPDLSVEGTVEIERMSDVMYVGRPVHGEPDSTISLFKVSQDGAEANRVQVALGKTSVNTVEIKKGLQVGDTVILSDMSQNDNVDRIQLK